MDFQNYRLPPIQEAVLDVFVTLPAEVDLDLLESIKEVLGSRFPDQKPRHQVSGTFKVDLIDASKSSADSATRQVGWIFRSPQNEKAVQARLDGFSFNRLPIYDGWSKFSSEAKEFWQAYKTVAHPEFIRSIGLRYVNRVLLPLPIQNLRDYCVLFPVQPKGVPSAMSEFLMRIKGPSTAAPDATSTVTLTFLPPPPDKAVLPMILDVHVERSFHALAVGDDKAIWDQFELLRAEKNLVFEASVTDAARATFR